MGRVVSLTPWSLYPREKSPLYPLNKRLVFDAHYYYYYYYYYEMGWAGHVARMGEERGCIGSWWGNRGKRDHWGDLGVDGWVILGWISRRWGVGIWTGLGWPRIETGGGRL